MPSHRHRFETPQGEEPLFYDQCHHSSSGNARIAEAILELIRFEAEPPNDS
jgi:hypothetical protein